MASVWFPIVWLRSTMLQASASRRALGLSNIVAETLLQIAPLKIQLVHDREGRHPAIDRHVDTL